MINPIIHIKRTKRFLLGMKIYKFRNFYLNPAERQVIKGENCLELTSRTFDVLQLLLENGGEVLTKDEILGKVWNGSFVEEGNLAVHISKLRRLLDETKNQPYIETVQGSGYRFVAPVHEASQSEWEKIFSGINPSLPENSPHEWTFDSIAVLPLQNESNDPEIEYLADGLTESFINSLSHLSNLRVIARNTVFRYKNKTPDAKEVGKTLGVATILTGRIRVMKDNLTIGIELTKTADGSQLWGTHFNRSFIDIFEIQESIIFEVSEKLRSEIGSIRESSAFITNNAESYKLFLKGKYFLDKWTEDNVYKAIEYFDKSVSFDPTNVYSYVEMIECYFMLYFCDYVSYTDVSTKITPLLSIVSEMNQNVDVLQAMYGAKKMYLDWDFKAAETHFQNALRINHSCLIARYRYSHLLLHSGKFKESLEQLQQISLIDPLSIINRIRIGRTFYKMRRYENALFYLREALELEPTNYVALAIIGAILTKLGDYDEALKLLEESLNAQFNIETLSCIGYLNAVKGDKDKAYQIIDQMKSLSENKNHSGMRLAKIYLALGNKDIAYELLDDAFEKHDVDLVSLKFHPIWTPINNETRFKNLLLKVGLPTD